MFEEPLSTDPIWSELGQQKIISWRYYESCRVHCLNLESMDVYMLIERTYPLSAEMCKAMLDKKLQGGKPDENCYKMLKMMEKQAGAKGLTSPEQTATGKGISNPFMAVMSEWLTGKETSNPFKIFNDSPLTGVNTPGSDENRLKLYDLMYILSRVLVTPGSVVTTGSAVTIKTVALLLKLEAFLLLVRCYYWYLVTTGSAVTTDVNGQVIESPELDNYGGNYKPGKKTAKADGPLLGKMKKWDEIEDFRQRPDHEQSANITSKISTTSKLSAHEEFLTKYQFRNIDELIDLPKVVRGDEVLDLEDKDTSASVKGTNVYYCNTCMVLCSSVVTSTWMTFGGNTCDLGSFGEETDKITDLHQILEEMLLTEHGDGVASIKRRRRDLASDGVWTLATASQRSLLKVNLEPSTTVSGASSDS
ncbi:hypothetical protein Tco_0331566, partial [Tanacetum coccineum]